jgi:hypothetical protein
MVARRARLLGNEKRGSVHLREVLPDLLLQLDDARYPGRRQGT